MTESTVRAMDTAEGYEFAIGQADLGAERGVLLVGEDFSDRKFMASLTVTEARQLAVMLMAAADDAEYVRPEAPRFDLAKPAMSVQLDG